MGLFSIKKTGKNKKNQFIKSVDSYNGNNETFVYNSYPNNQMINNQPPMNYQNNMNPNMQPNMNYNQPMNNQMNMNNQQMNNNTMINQQMEMPMNNQYSNGQVMVNSQNNISNYNNQQVNYQNNNPIIIPKKKEAEVKLNIIKPKMNRNDEQIDVLEPDVLNETLDERPVENNIQNNNNSATNVEKTIEQLNPLNNANNPIPVNPVAEVEEKEVLTDDIINAKASIFAILGMIIGMIFRPGSTIIDSIRKYKNFYKGIMITVWITVVTLILTIVVRVVTGSFYRTYNNITGAYSINFNFNNVLSIQNYLPYLVIAFLCSFVAIFIVTLIYYASSFFNSKGVTFGSYLAVSNVTIIPIILGVVVLNPVLAIISDYLAIIGIIVPAIYSLISFIIGIDYILKFNSLNAKIYYNVFNISLILFIMVLIVMGLVNFNLISMPSLFTS